MNNLPLDILTLILNDCSVHLSLVCKRWYRAERQRTVLSCWRTVPASALKKYSRLRQVYILCIKVEINDDISHLSSPLFTLLGPPEPFFRLIKAQPSIVANCAGTYYNNGRLTLTDERIRDLSILDRIQTLDLGQLQREIPKLPKIVERLRFSLDNWPGAPAFPHLPESCEISVVEIYSILRSGYVQTFYESRWPKIKFEFS